MTNKTINERLISFSGKGCISKDLCLGDDVVVKVKGGVITVENKDNQDGTQDIVFKVKITEIEL